MKAMHKAEFVRQLLGRFGLSSALVIAGRLSVLLLLLIGARVANTTEFGLFVFAMTASQVLAMLCSVGTAPASQIIFGEARGRGRLKRIPCFVRLALTVTIVVSLAISLLFGAASLVSAHLFPQSSASDILFATAIFLPIMSLSMLREYVARAMEQVVLAFVPRDIVWSLVFGVSILLVPSTREHLVPTGAAILAIIELPLWIGVWRLARRKGGLGPPLPCRPYRRWTARSTAMVTNFVAGLCFERIDVLMIAVFSPLSAAGIYGAASRVAPLISTAQRFVIPILTPKVAEALSLSDYPAASREVRFGVLASSSLAVPGAIFVMLFATPIMELFGPQFEEGATVLRVLSVAHLAIAVGSNFSVPVMASARPWIFARTIWAALILTAIAMPASIHFFGSVGAAATVAAGILSYTVAVAIIAKGILQPSARSASRPARYGNTGR